MSSLESFGRLLNETVSGEKLSSSKVEKVRDSAARQFCRGAKVCSIILKVHTRASSRTLLSSLYLFDAICRYAADIVRKKASGFDYKEAEPPKDSSAEAGTKQALVESATSFLHSASEIVQEIVLTTMEAVRVDQQPKVTKVVDIWLKAGTFEEDLLYRIKRRLSSTTKEESTSKIPNASSSNQGSRSSEKQEGNSMGSPYGMLMKEEPSMEPKRTDTPPSIPSNLLALLGGGKKESQVLSSVDTKQNGSDEPKQAAPTLDASQLAILQQIAQQNSRQNAPVNEPSFPPPPTIQNRGEPTQRRPSPSVPISVPPPSLPPTQPPTEQKKDDTLSFAPDPSIGDLSQFNFNLFDPTSPSHWIQFAQHWHNTYQYIPSNQECMWAMMSALQSQSQSYMGNYDNSSW